MLHSLQKLQRHVVLLCLYGMLSRIISRFRWQPCCFPKASAKVGLFSELQNFYRRNFQKSGEKIYHTVKNRAIMTNIIQFYKNSQSFSLASKFNFSKKIKTWTWKHCLCPAKVDIFSQKQKYYWKISHQE